jgi:hypothetical protein
MGDLSDFEGGQMVDVRLAGDSVKKKKKRKRKRKKKKERKKEKKKKPPHY